jgi:DNA-binding response OmpR family regulator
MPLKSVLIVDDDCAVSKLLRYNLAAEGLSVLTADDGLEGVETAFEKAPDLVVLDLHMPKLNGWEVLWQLRNDSRTANTPIIMLTVQGDEDSVTEGWTRGVDCYLPKPFDIGELIIMVKRLLEVADEEAMTAGLAG